MSTWLVKDGNAEEPLMVVETAPGGVSLHIPSIDPVVVTRAKAEEIRLAIGAALGEGDDGS